jgi:hypothetical protein
MPIIGDTNTTPPVEQPVAVLVTAKEFRGVTVDTTYEPATSLLTHVEGASWTVNYYSQVLGADNALSGQSLDRPAVYQQYKLIQKFELKVTTALNQSQDPGSKGFNVTGQANVFPCGLVPNEGDHFLADVGDGREGLFMVTSSERRSIYKDAAFVIDYVQVSYSEQDNRVNDLNSKVVENLYFERDFLENGQNPLISYDENRLIKELRNYYEELVDFYFTRFFSQEYRTLLLPGQDRSMYDPFLTRAVLKMFRDENHPNIKYLRELNVGEDDNYDISNVWTALLTKRRKELINCMSKIGLVLTRAFSADPVMDSIRYAGIDFAVYPADPDLSEDYRRKNYTKTISSVAIKPTPTRLVDLFELIQISELYGLPSNKAPAVNAVAYDTYIFSPAFYADTHPGQSGLEIAFHDYLDGKAYDLSTLTDLAKTYTSWGPLEQFYQMPFLMALMRSAIRRL